MTYGDLGTQIRGLSPEDLDIFKRQLPLRLKQMTEVDRNTALEQLQRIPELQEIPLAGVGEPPLWQKGLETVTTPFRLAQEYAFTPWAAAVTSPAYRRGEEVSFQSFMPGGEMRQAYEAWEAPKFVKGTAEFLPWLGLPTAAGLVGRLGAVSGRGAGFAQLGVKALKPVAAVERAITYPIAKPIEKLSEKFLPKLAKPQEFFSVPASETIERQITKDDWFRRVATWFGRKPVFGKMTEAVGGKAATIGTTQAVEDVTARALLVGIRVQETLLNSRAAGFAKLRMINPDPIKLFNIDEATGLAKIATKKGFGGASKAINDIAEHPTKYVLNASQKEYITEVHRIEDMILEALKREGVDVKLLKFDEFSHWVHRVVKGKKVDGKFLELRKGFGRIGAKQSFEKTRFYESAADGIEHGVVYSPNLEQALDLYAQSAAKRIADQRIAGMVAEFGKKPVERAWEMAPKVMIGARETAVTLAGARHLVKIINRAARGEKLPEATLIAQERRFPELAGRLRETLGDKPALKRLSKETQQIVEAAKEPYWKAKAKRVEIMGVAKTPTLGTEATIFHPAFQGKIYPIGVAGEIQKYFSDLGFTPIQKLATVSGTMRTLVAAADFSAMFIQGLPTIFLHPKAWGRGAAMSFKAFKNPRLYQKYLTQELPTIQERVYYGGFAGGFEYFEAMGALQRAAGMATRITTGKARYGQIAVRQSYGRFEASFGSFGDVCRNEMWKGMKGSVKGEAELFELARHLDRMTGVMSMKGLGIGRTQRDFETAFVFFAPRYTRAGFALVSDVFKGGLTGREAQKALASMMAGGAIFYSGICETLGQEPNFDPATGRFMTIEIEDPMTGTTRHFGIGGMMTSLMRFGADVTASALDVGMNEPTDFVKLSRMDNPFMRFMFSKSAPLTGFATGMIEGKNYFGEPFENTGDYAKFMAEQVTPIALQEMLFEEGGMAPSTIVAEEMGMRTFPQSDWEKRDLVRDRLAQETFGMNWEDLGTQRGELYQRLLERDSPELQQATDLASETSSKMARGEGIVWKDWKNEGQDIEKYSQDQIVTASRKFDMDGDGTSFRQKIDEIYANRRALYARRERDEKYTAVYQFFNEPLDPRVAEKMNPNDLARREYYQMMYTPDMYDVYGDYRFDEADRREALFVQRYGQSALDYVEEYMGARWEEPTALQMLRQARELLKPYWDIQEAIWRNYPPELRQISDSVMILERTDPQQAKNILMQYPAILMARRMVALYRKQFKLSSPQIANALNMFYRY